MLNNLTDPEATADAVTSAARLLTALKEMRDVLDWCAKDTAGTPREGFFKAKVGYCNLVIYEAEASALSNAVKPAEKGSGQ